jgi:hypothetical protein
VVIPLKILLELKKTTLLQQQKLSKAPRFVLGLLFCLNKPAPKRKCKTLMVLRHYTSGKPCLSSVFSLLSDPKLQQAYPIRRPLRPD